MTVIHRHLTNCFPFRSALSSKFSELERVVFFFLLMLTLKYVWILWYSFTKRWSLCYFPWTWVEICDLFNGKNMAEARWHRHKTRLVKLRLLIAVSLGTCSGGFSHRVRSLATLRPPFRAIVCERALGWGGSGEERSEELELLAVQVCPAQVLTCKLRLQDDIFQLLSHCNLKGHSEQEAPS